MDEFIFSDGLGDLDQRNSLSSNLLAQQQQQQQQNYHSQPLEIGKGLEQNIREPVIELTEGPATTVWNKTPPLNIQKEPELKVSVILTCTSCNQRYQVVGHRELLAKPLIFKCTYCQRNNNNNNTPNSGPRTYSQPNKNKQQVVKNECEICGAMFVDIANLIKHLYVHCVQSPAADDSENPPRPRRQKNPASSSVTTDSASSNKCQYCSQTFTFLSALKYHEKGHQKYFRSKILEKCSTTKKAPVQSGPVNIKYSNGLLWCNCCHQTFKDEAERKKHMLALHVKPLVFKCPVCNEGFRSKSRLNDHALTHSQETKHQCQFCGETFLYVSSLMRHQRIAHRPTVSRQQAKAEEQKPVLPSAPAVPDETVTEVVNTILNCLEAAESDSQASVAVRETASFLYPLYETLREPCPCPVCRKRFKNHVALASHVKVHRNPNKGLHCFQCKDCGLFFSKNMALLQHCKKHLKAKSTSSRVASKRPKRRSDDPQNLSLSKFAGKRLECPDCGLVFSPGSCFTEHKKNHKQDNESSGGPRLEGNGRLGRCLVCDQRFLSKSDVVQHFAAHADEIPYTCSICGKVFAYRKFFESHCRLISYED